MNGLFFNSSFNQPLNNWNVSNVKYMDSIFSFAYEFNQDINNWNVSNVENMA
jgi:lipoprotein